MNLPARERRAIFRALGLGGVLAFGAWIIGGWAWGAFGAWGALQLLYVAFIEIIRHRDHPDPVAEYSLGDATTSKATIVLIHGFADTPEAWRREAEALAAQGFYVVVPNLSHSATDREWLPHLQTLVQAARGPVILWGHSMGAAVALILARSLRPAALVLWAPFLAPRLGRRFTAVLYWVHRALFRYPYTITYFPSDRHGKGTPETHYRVGRVIPTATFAAMLRLQYRAEAAARALTQAQGQGKACPTLVLLSRRETVVDNGLIRRALPEVDTRFAADPTSSHALTNAADWHTNLTASLAWLANQGIEGIPSRATPGGAGA